MFGTDWKKQFDSLCAGSAGNLKETDLFGNLVSALADVTVFPYAHILHGRTYLVDYSHGREYIDVDNATCELCDIMFIAISGSDDTARLCFMQTKKKFDFDLTKAKFPANLIQFHLLNARLLFDHKKGHKTIKDIDVLNSSDQKSVAAYGVFYKTGSQYDMCYYSADNLEVMHKLTKKLCLRDRDRVVQKKSAPPFLEFDSVARECKYCENLESFGNRLTNMEIGREYNCVAELVTELNNIEILEIIRTSFPDLLKSYLPQDVQRNADAVSAKYIVILDCDSLKDSAN